MRQFREMYGIMKRFDEVLASAYDNGLEMRAGNFFYDPETKQYNDKFRNRMLAVQDERTKFIDESLSSGGFYKFIKNVITYGVAEAITHIFHPLKTKKAKRLVKEVREFYGEV